LFNQFGMLERCALRNGNVHSADGWRDVLDPVIARYAGLHLLGPIGRIWGGGQSASSDGQFFPTTRQGEAMNLINAKYGHEPGLKAYTHVSDQFGPFATQTIPATVTARQCAALFDLDRQQDPRRRHRPELAGRPACRGHHGDGRPAAQSVAQEVRRLPESTPTMAASSRQFFEVPIGNIKLLNG
jgi:hypothetical protein